jgi:hypothetical protein
MELLEIKNFEFIGDSLSAININFEVLDNTIENLNINTEKFLNPYVNFFKQNEKKLTYLINVLYDKKPNWDRMVSIVELNSAKWIKPIVFIDPNVYKFPDSNLNSTIDYIVDTFKSLYPILNNNIPSYIENQKAIIYYYVNHVHNKIILNDTVNSNIANCVSEGTKTAIVNCQNKTNFSQIHIPYAAKLLFQELNTMNVAPRIMTTNV